MTGRDARLRGVGWLVCVISILLGLGAAPIVVGAEAGGTLRVVSFNLRYASPKPPNSWPERRPVMRECVLKMDPDVMGTQEGVYHQLKDLAADLPAYDWIGLGREGGSKGEFMAVFFKKDRLEALAFDHFWLSDTPEVMGSATWGHSNRRMLTWVRFRDRKTGKEFILMNTHFDHQVQLAREKAAALIWQRVEVMKTELPVLLIGDFNAEAGKNAAYEVLVQAGRFTDTWTAAQERKGEGINTFHDFRGPRNGGIRIDWILSRGAVQAHSAEVVTFARGEQYPSDHFPIVSVVSF